MSESVFHASRRMKGALKSEVGRRLSVHFHSDSSADGLFSLLLNALCILFVFLWVMQKFVRWVFRLVKRHLRGV